MRSTLPSLSALGSLPPPTFFFSLTQSKLALVEEKDCLGKDVKRICLVAHQSLQQSIKYNAEERQSAPPLHPLILKLAVGFFPPFSYSMDTVTFKSLS